MAGKLKFSGPYAEVKDSLDGVVFAGVNGAPPVLSDVRVGKDEKKDCPVLEFVLQIASYKRPREEGYEPIESCEMMATWRISGEKNDEWTIRALNDGLGLSGDDALLDDNKSWKRLLIPGHPKSLVPLIGKETKSLFIKAGVKPSPRDGENGSMVFYNLFAPPKRVSAKSGGLTETELNQMLGLSDDDEPTGF